MAYCDNNIFLKFYETYQRCNKLTIWMYQIQKRIFNLSMIIPSHYSHIVD